MHHSLSYFHDIVLSLEVRNSESLPKTILFSSDELRFFRDALLVVDIRGVLKLHNIKSDRI